ncbi:MAG: V-type ATP synthase subunit A, partial [Acidobacteriota bacterium]|nr:V-type ATP synthase subunit A [Acidobacteriota bacterium]
MEKSIINWISGPVVKVSQAGKFHLNEMVEVGPEKLIGEVIELEEDMATIQVYEDTTGLKPGIPVSGKGLPLYVELGPGLIGTIFDGLQRPLTSLENLWGTFLQRGKGALALDREKIWHFEPQIKKGDIVKGGEIIGVVPETHILNRYILVPPDVSGKVIDAVPSGDYTIEDIIATIQNDKNNNRKALKLYHRWPIRIPRPYKNKLAPQEPLITGQRVIDVFFPLSKGGTAAIPGGFGTGKTITQHQLSKWADADIIIYIGCGE